ELAAPAVELPLDDCGDVPGDVRILGWTGQSGRRVGNNAQRDRNGCASARSPALRCVRRDYVSTERHDVVLRQTSGQCPQPVRAIGERPARVAWRLPFPWSQTPDAMPARERVTAKALRASCRYR